MEKLYVSTVNMSTGTVNIRTKEVASLQYPLSITPPAGYENADIYVDGVAFATNKSDSAYSVNITNSNARTATMYKYDANGIPRGMYVWRITYNNGAYTATALPGLENLLSYHGFSIRIKEPAGIRFKSGIDVNTRAALLGSGVDGYHLQEYGTLYITASNMSDYQFTRISRKTIFG